MPHIWNLLFWHSKFVLQKQGYEIGWTSGHLFLCFPSIINTTKTRGGLKCSYILEEGIHSFGICLLFMPRSFCCCCVKPKAVLMLEDQVVLALTSFWKSFDQCNTQIAIHKMVTCVGICIKVVNSLYGGYEWSKARWVVALWWQTLVLSEAHLWIH